MPRIKIELHAWLVSSRSAEEKLGIELEVAPDATVRQVLAELAKRYKSVNECVVSAQTGEYQGTALLVLNGRSLELVGGLDTTFETGDVLDVVPAYTGG